MHNLQSLSRTRIPTGAIVLLALLVSSCAPKDDAAKAEAEVNRFHKNWNLWEFAAVYNDAHKGFRTLQRPEKLIATLEAVRKTNGEFKSAKQRSVIVSFDHLEKDITLKYDSVYEHTSAVETF